MEYDDAHGGSRRGKLGRQLVLLGNVGILGVENEQLDAGQGLCVREGGEPEVRELIGSCISRGHVEVAERDPQGARRSSQPGVGVSSAPTNKPGLPWEVDLVAGFHERVHRAPCANPGPHPGGDPLLGRVGHARLAEGEELGVGEGASFGPVVVGDGLVVFVTD